MTAADEERRKIAREIADYHFDEHDLAEKIAGALAAEYRRGMEECIAAAVNWQIANNGPVGIAAAIRARTATAPKEKAPDGA